MTARVNDAIDTIVTTFEALTAPTDPTITYHHLDDDEDLDDTMADRGFFFEAPLRSQTVSEAADASSALVEWDLTARLHLSMARYGRRALTRACADEGNLLIRSVDRVTTWPAGVLEVITNDLDAEAFEIDDAGFAIVTFNFTALCEETD